MNKQITRTIESWKRSTDNDIYDAFKSPSIYKVRAWEHCKYLCYKMNGTNLKVISHTCQFFSAAFQYVDADTGVVRLMHITPSYNRVYDMI